MKRMLALLVIGFTVLSLVACGGSNSSRDRIMYKKVNLEKYVNLVDYKSITVDTSSDKYKEIYEDVISTDIENNEFYVKKTEGTVADGDVVNIDYVGKKDGVAFDGGTAQNYDLEIGSNSFIAGFESGLIGAEIGKSIDLNLTFPENYGNDELNGAAVVFTVNVNYVKTDEKLEPKDYYGELKFKSLEEYENDVKDRAIENFLAEAIVENSEVKKYPEDDKEFLTEQMTDYFTKQLSSYYNITLESYLTQNDMTRESFDLTLTEEQVYPLMDQIMPMYAILDNEHIEITSDDINAKIDELVSQYDSGSVTADVLKEFYGEYYFENLVASEKAVEIVKNNAKIK